MTRHRLLAGAVLAAVLVTLIVVVVSTGGSGSDGPAARSGSFVGPGPASCRPARSVGRVANTPMTLASPVTGAEQGKLAGPVQISFLLKGASTPPYARVDFLIDDRLCDRISSDPGFPWRDPDHRDRVYAFASPASARSALRGRSGAWDTRRWPDGRHRIEVRAYDSAGQVHVATKDVVVDNHPLELRFGDGLFSAESVWRRPLPTETRLDPRSGALAAALAATVRDESALGLAPNLDVVGAAAPIYRVGPDAKAVPLYQPAGPGSVLPALDANGDPVRMDGELAEAPIPGDAEPPPATDGELVVYQTDAQGRGARLYEFFRARRARTADDPDAPPRDDGGWIVEGAHHIDDLADNRTGAPGSTAAGFSTAAGQITLDDLRRGAIDHALKFSLNAVRAGVHALPALYGDGKCVMPGTTADGVGSGRHVGCPDALPEGARLRLPADYRARPDAPLLERMMIDAARRYGIIVVDIGSVTSFTLENPNGFGRDSYADYLGAAYPERQASTLIEHFPFRALQVTRMRLADDPHADTPPALSGADGVQTLCLAVAETRACNPPDDAITVLAPLRGIVRLRGLALDFNGVDHVTYRVPGASPRTLDRRPFAFAPEDRWDTRDAPNGMQQVSFEAVDNWGATRTVTATVTIAN